MPISLSFFKKYFFTIGATLFIWVLVLIPLSQLPKVDSPFFAVDKAVHLLFFLIWELLFFIEARGKVALIRIMCIGVLFAISTEISQIFTKDRMFDLYDAMYDCFGLIIGFVVWKGITKLFGK